MDNVEPGTAAHDPADIDRIAHAFVDDGKAPGLAYGIVAGGQIVHAGGVGIVAAGGGSPNTESVFRIASMTKSFTAAAALLLRDEGLLDLDAPVEVYVPAAAGVRSASDDAPPLTLRMLLTMSGGFPSDDPWADRQESMSPDAFAALLRAGPRLATVPGTEYQYSNLGYAIAGRAVANVAGRSLQSFVTERLLRPLGMNATCFSSDDVPAEHLVVGHRRVDDETTIAAGGSSPWVPEPFDRPGEFSAIGGLYSSVADLAVWVTGFNNAAQRPIVTDDHPLRPSTRREMQQLHRLSGVATSTVDGAVHAVAKGYGFGLTRERHTYWGDVVAHSGGYPGFGSNMRWHPVSGYGVIALANSTYAAPSVAAAAMLEALLRAGAPRTRPPDAWPEVAEMRHAADELISAWDDDLADRVFAMNMDLDEPRDERRRRVAKVIARLGELDPTAGPDDDLVTACDLDWTVTGSLGRARVEMGLSVEPSPKIQVFEIEMIAPDSDASGHVAALQHRPLGKSGLSVSLMSLGSWRTFERLSRDEGIAVMTAAREAGIDFLDDARYDDETGKAPIPTGWSEVVFGELFRASGWQRDEVTVANKLWWEHWPEQDAVAELDGSLRRMGLDHVDLIYAIHPPANLSIGDVVGQVATLLTSGRARAWGTGMWSAAQIGEALEICATTGVAPPVAAQMSCSLAEHQQASDADMCAVLSRGGIGLIGAYVLAGGTLSGKYDGDATRGRAAADDSPVIRRGKEIAVGLGALAREWGVPTSHLAFAYALGHPNLASIVFGATSPEQVRANVAAIATFEQLDATQRAAIDALA